MRNSKLKRFSSYLLPILVFIPTLLLGCGSLVTLNASREKYDKINETDKPDLSNDMFLQDAAQRFGLMALFAEVVYRRDLPTAVRDGNGCRYLTAPSDPNISYGMPSQPNQAGGWRRWIPKSPLQGAEACVDKDGLYYETYVHENSEEKITEAVIAFRGTENRKGQYLNDWSTNLKASIGIEPKQYELASQAVPIVLEGLRERFKQDQTEIKIYVTGHSLGGGLAQSAGYLDKDIKEVFTFNTTPVTNWSFLRLRGAVKNAYPIIHRVYHGGEFLEKVRFVSSNFTEARYGRHDIGLQFEGRSDFHGHSMKIIACNFSDLLSKRTEFDPAPHKLPISYATKVANKLATTDLDYYICNNADDHE